MVSTRKRFAGIAAAVVSALVLGACGAAAVKPTSLLPHLHGARTPSGDLVIDEVRGRFGGLYLGMSVTAAKKKMPAANYWSSLHAGQDLSYCNRPERNNCDGAVYLGIFGACEIGINQTTACDSADAAGPVAEIDLSANGNPLRNREGHEAVTLRGIRLPGKRAPL